MGHFSLALFSIGNLKRELLYLASSITCVCVIRVIIKVNAY